MPLDRRIGIAEVEQVYPEPRRWLQAVRCLQCHVSPVFNGDKCILCGGCADVCPENCLRLVDVASLRGDEKLQAAFLARYGRVPERRRAGRDHQRRNPLHPLRPVRCALPDGRHHDGTCRTDARLI